VEPRFFSTTRGRIIALLRRHSRTVDELADVLGVTANGVRAHLTTLERDGLVTREGERRGAGKPAGLYAITAKAEQLFPKAYGLTLEVLLDTLAQRLTPEERRQALTAAGGRLAAAVGGIPSRAAQPQRRDREERRARIERAAALLEELGGLVDVEARGDDLVIRGYRCPLADVSAGHPEVCRIVQGLLETVIQEPVRELCQRATGGTCWFEVDAA
jgi:predicted ArsR family transcriptional regulator